MEPNTIPTSPNWFLCSASAGNIAGLYAFGAKTDVYVYDTSPAATTSSVPPSDAATDGAGAFRLVGCYYGHSFDNDKVTAVALHPDPSQWVCCSADNFIVNLWDIRSLVTMQSHSEHKDKITCMEWPATDHGIVLTGDERGTIVVWTLKSNTVKSFRLEKEYVFTMKMSPHDPCRLAVGYRSGVSLVVSLENDSPHILHRLRGHETEIMCLAWCPVREVDVGRGEDTQNDDLIITADRRCMKIWSATKGKELQTRKFPHSNLFSPSTYDQGSRRAWFSLHWPKFDPFKIFFTSLSGDMLTWDLKEKPKAEPEKISVKDMISHTRMVFNMVPLSAQGHKVASFSFDRSVVIWDLEARSAVTSLSTIGGVVFCARASTVDPGCVAIGCGDNMIRVWNMACRTNPFDISTHFYGMKSKITAVSWHPRKEGCLAYGTEDGRVGVYNLLANNRSPAMSATFHKKTVYVVGWGPPLESTGRDFEVYTVGDGAVLQHYMPDGESLREGVNVLKAVQDANGLDKMQKASEFAWSPDFTSFAVGTEHGSVTVYSFPSLTPIATATLHKKIINCVRWHPPTTTASPHQSPCQSLVAIAGADNVISIIDLAQVHLHSGSDPLDISAPHRQLQGHYQRTTDVCWSPHHDGRLVSVGYDNMALVWDVPSCRVLAAFKGHEGRLLTCLWSDLDPDLVMSGGADSTFRVWRVAEQPSEVTPQERKKKSRPKAAQAPKAVRGSGQKVGRSERSKGNNHASNNHASNNHASSPEELASQDDLDELQALMEMKQLQLRAQENGADDSSSPEKEIKDKRLSPTKKYVPKVSTQKATPRMVVSYTDISEDSGPNGRTAPQDQQARGDNCQASSGEEGEVTPSIADIVAPVRLMETKHKAGGGKSADASSEKQPRKRKAKLRSMFPVSSQAGNTGNKGNREDLMDLATLMFGGASHDIVDAKPHLGLYTDRLGAHTCLLQESSHHLQNDNMDYHLQLELWRGNVAGALQVARQKGELSDWIVSMAPMASYELWEQVSIEYAEQLEEDGQYHKAATYLLAAQRVHQAIDLFRRHRLYKEAVSLAKVRLSSIDPLLEDLYTEWGQTLMKDGQYEHAAKCYLAMRQVQEAGQLMARRADAASLKVACHMTLMDAQCQDQGLDYGFKLLSDHLTTGEWLGGHSFVTEQPALRVLQPLLCTHELLCTQLTNLYPDLALTSKFDLDTCVFKGKMETPKGKAEPPEFMLAQSEWDPVVPWPPHLLAGRTFPHHVLRAWCLRLDMGLLLGGGLKVMQATLARVGGLMGASQDITQVMVCVSLDVTLCLLALLTSDTTSAVTHLLQALARLYQGGHAKVMQGLCRLMLPQGPRYLLKLQQEFNASRVLLTMESDCDIGHAGVENHNTIKKHLTEIKDSGQITMASARCRELDCVRAYFYLVVLDHLKAEADEKKVADSEIQDGCPTDLLAGDDSSRVMHSIADWSLSKVIPSGGVKVTPKAMVTNGNQPSDNLSGSKETDNNTAHLVSSGQDRALNCDSTGCVSTISTVTVKGDLNASLSQPPSSSVDPPHAKPSSPTKGSNSASSSLSSSSSSSSSPLEFHSATSVVSPPTNPSFTSTSDLNSNNSNAAAVNGNSQAAVDNLSVPDTTVVPSTSSSVKASIPASTLPSSPSAPTSPSRVSTSPKAATSQRGVMSHQNLLRLSKGILWDIQAKREALTETLGHIHRAISQHLLASRSSEPTTNRTNPLDIRPGNSDDRDGGSNPPESPNPPSPSLLSTTPDILKGAHFKTGQSDTEEPLSKSNQSNPGANNKTGLSAPTTYQTGQSHPGSPVEQRQRFEVQFKGPMRSLSEPAPLSGLETKLGAPGSVSFQVERDLLGSYTNDFLACDQKDRKILWMDSASDPVTSPGGRGVTSDLPLDWEDLAVDVKYSRPYVTLGLLRREQDKLSQELKRTPDVSKLKFPCSQQSVQKLLTLTLAAPSLTPEERSSYVRQLCDWASLFSVTSRHKAETDAMFSQALTELGDESR